MPAREGPTKIEAVFKPARNNGGLTTVSTQVGGYGTALLGSIRLDSTPSTLRSNQYSQTAQQRSKLLNSSRFSNFEIFRISVAFLTQKADPSVSLYRAHESDHRGARDPVDFSVPVAYHSIVVVVV